MKTLELRFTDDKGSTVLISIPHPKEPVEAEDVGKVMDGIIKTEAFGTRGSKLVSKASARLVERHVEPIHINIE